MIACDFARLVLMVLLSLVSVAHLPVVLAARRERGPFGRHRVDFVLGPAFSGILLLLGSPAVAFALNAVTFGISALAVLAIPASEAFRPAGTGKRSGGLLRDVTTGAAVLRSQRRGA